MRLTAPRAVISISTSLPGRENPSTSSISACSSGTAASAATSANSASGSCSRCRKNETRTTFSQSQPVSAKSARARGRISAHCACRLGLVLAGHAGQEHHRAPHQVPDEALLRLMLAHMAGRIAGRRHHGEQIEADIGRGSEMRHADIARPGRPRAPDQRQPTRLAAGGARRGRAPEHAGAHRVAQEREPERRELGARRSEQFGSLLRQRPPGLALEVEIDEVVSLPIEPSPAHSWLPGPARAALARRSLARSRAVRQSAARADPVPQPLRRRSAPPAPQACAAAGSGLSRTPARGSLRLAAQDVALSRRKQGFESPRERQLRMQEPSSFLRRSIATSSGERCRRWYQSAGSFDAGCDGSFCKNKHGVYFVRKKVPKALQERAVARGAQVTRVRQTFLQKSLDTKD